MHALPAHRYKEHMHFFHTLPVHYLFINLFKHIKRLYIGKRRNMKLVIVHKYVEASVPVNMRHTEKTHALIINP